MKVLIIGGTVFLGRHLVEAAMSRGHDVTLFNRGQHNPDLFPEVEKIRGDRDGGLDALQGRTWDAVVDTCGYVPRVVSASSEALADASAHYTFISTISVYPNVSKPGIDESSQVGTLDDESTEEVTGETYGPLKALSEQAAEAAMPGRTLIIRPGLIVGPFDPTDRFTYWPERVAYGGEILAPGTPQRPIQFIDVRDLAEWNIRMVEAGETGVYNADGPDRTLPIAELLETSKEVSGSDAHFTWVDQEFLLEQGVSPWTDLPAWVPETDEYAGFFSISSDKAIAHGLTFRPLADTVRDTLSWNATRPAERERRAGLAPEREIEVLKLWHERNGNTNQ